MTDAVPADPYPDAIEVAVKPTTAALAPIHGEGGALVRPAASVSDIEAAFHDYQSLCARLLDDSDFQSIAGKKFRKKSAWRKLAVAFGVSCEMVERTYDRNEQGRIERAEVLMRATAPNGRSMVGLGACDLFEKCCDPATCKTDEFWKDSGKRRHTHCAIDCPGTIHFSSSQHDIPATAMTRATNRACSDLFGMGEVSAEEINDRDRAAQVAQVSELDSSRSSIAARIRHLSPDEQATLRGWMGEHNYPPKVGLWSQDQIEGCDNFLDVQATNGAATPAYAPGEEPFEAASDDHAARLARVRAEQDAMTAIHRGASGGQEGQEAPTGPEAAENGSEAPTAAAELTGEERSHAAHEAWQAEREAAKT